MESLLQCLIISDKALENYLQAAVDIASLYAL
jgi:hypothetical protein